MWFFRKSNRKALGILATVSGSLCLIASAVWAIHSYRFNLVALRTSGLITQLVERHGDHGDAFYPVFTFVDGVGVTRTVYSDTGSYPPAHQVGDTVTVLYLPGAERDAKIDDWFVVWGAQSCLPRWASSTCQSVWWCARGLGSSKGGGHGKEFSLKCSGVTV
jgi:hypothetical protein